MFSYLGRGTKEDLKIKLEPEKPFWMTLLLNFLKTKTNKHIYLSHLKHHSHLLSYFIFKAIIDVDSSRNVVEFGIHFEGETGAIFH